PGLSATRTARGTARSTNFIFASFLQGLADQGRLKQNQGYPELGQQDERDGRQISATGESVRTKGQLGRRDTGRGTRRDGVDKRRQGLSHRRFIEMARRGRCKTTFGYLTDKVNSQRTERTTKATD
ncbi:hypothetical protein CF326_g10016, partial [Tilletia indica]